MGVWGHFDGFSETVNLKVLLRPSEIGCDSLGCGVTNM
jgi:hypothetical protein